MVWRTVPDSILDVLKSRYQFIIAEREAVFELNEPYQTCSTCKDWSSSSNAVKCE